MARIRTLKPEFWQDEKLSPLPPIDRLVFLGLISQADDAGRLVDNPRLIDGLLFPETEDSSRGSLETLARLDRIIRYRSDSGQKLIQIAGWDRHQKVQKPSVYVLPGPPDGEQSGESPESVQSVSGESPSPIPDPRPTTNDLTDTVSNETGTGVPPSYPHSASETDALTDGDLMGLCRRRLYVSGRPPTGRTEGQDMNTIRTMLSHGIRPAAIAEMIEAAAVMRNDGRCGFADQTESLSMGALYFKPKKAGDWTPRPFANEALEYYHKKMAGTRDRPKNLPPRVGDVLRLAIGG